MNEDIQKNEFSIEKKEFLNRIIFSIPDDEEIIYLDYKLKWYYIYLKYGIIFFFYDLIMIFIFFNSAIPLEYLIILIFLMIMVLGTGVLVKMALYKRFRIDQKFYLFIILMISILIGCLILFLGINFGLRLLNFGLSIRINLFSIILLIIYAIIFPVLLYPRLKFKIAYKMIIFTDKALYRVIKKYENTMILYNDGIPPRFPYNRIKAYYYTYTNFFFMKNKGKLMLLMDRESLPNIKNQIIGFKQNRIALKNIKKGLFEVAIISKNFDKIKEIFESMIYHYQPPEKQYLLSFNKSWNVDMNNSTINFKISSDLFIKAFKRKRKMFIIISSFILIVIAVALYILLFLPSYMLVGEPGTTIPDLIFIVFLIIMVSFSPFYIYEFFRLTKYSLPENYEININNSNVIFFKKKQQVEISFSNKLLIKLNGVSKMNNLNIGVSSMKWKDMDSLILRDIETPHYQIIIGPVENFHNFYYTYQYYYYKNLELQNKIFSPNEIYNQMINENEFKKFLIKKILL